VAIQRGPWRGWVESGWFEDAIDDGKWLQVQQQMWFGADGFTAAQ